MERKRWVQVIIFLFVAITGLVDLALFLFGNAGAEVGILGIFGMMIAFWYYLSRRMIEMKKEMIEMKKEIKELKEEK